MAIGKVNYKTGQNLEPIANAITSMNQSSTKKDKPVEMAEKIKAISTDATATEGNVLNGQTFYSGGSKKTGSMVNNGAVSSSLNAGGSYTIPKGYHDGSGKVTANSLASQTAATANASQILSGRTAYVNGAKVTGSMPNKGAWSSSLGINGSLTIPEGYHNGQGKITQSIATKGAQTYTPKTTNQVIGAGQYLSGAQTILGDPNLVPANIVKGKTIFGIAGSYVCLPPLFIIQNGQWQNSFGTLMALPAYPTSRFERVQNSGNYMEFFTASTGNSPPHCMEVLSKVLDVTNYNRMVIKFASKAFPNLIDTFDIFIVPTNRISEVKLQGHTSSLVLGADYSPVYYNTSSSTASDNRILEWDLSTLTGAYYLVINAKSAGYYNNLSVCISNIYLSAEPKINL